MKINNSSDLNAIKEDSDVELCTNIELSDEKQVDMLNTFYGVFNGNGHTISNLQNPLFESIRADGVVKNLTLQNPEYIGDVASSEIDIQLFGFVACESKGTIKNVSVKNGHIECENSKKTGLIVGYSSHLGDSESCIKNCTGSGFVEGDTVVGGLIGRTYEAQLEQLYFSGTVCGSITGGLIGEVKFSELVRSKCEGTVRGESVGGCIAAADYSKIQQCGSQSDVKALVNAGGFCYELSDTTVLKSYSTGKVSSKDQVGGFVCYSTASTLDSIFWNFPDSTLSDEYKTENSVTHNANEIESILLF